jgi:uncharacterized repeat protein (TIGR03803 family)
VKSIPTFPIRKQIFALAFALGLATVAIPQTQAQSFKVVYNFTGASDGGNPLDGFVADTLGNLFSTTSAGGALGNGAVIKFSKAGAESVLYSFAGGTDGANPQAGLLRDKSGNLYGTTYAGGKENLGTVFMVTAAGAEEVLYSFATGKDAAYPEAGLTIDAQGNLYGTASAGGTYNNGAVFRLTPPKTGSTWKETLLYSFGGTGTDGQAPVASLTLGAAGTLYGTTSTGGEYGYGTIFQLVRSGATWEETILHNFADGDDGGIPYGGLIANKAGSLYGAATEGGTGGGGTIFELTPSNGSWTFTVLYSNPGWGISGSFRNLLLDASGNLYGTTHCDGADSAGTVYKLTPASGSWTYTSLYSFTGGTDGLYVYSNPVLLEGHIYGTTKLGGAHGYGVIWQVVP